MSSIHSFAPIEPERARVLILGSMPGKASLRAGQYYAHPRNGFWPILSRLLGFDPELPYDGRVEALRAHGVGVWDVLQTCTRTSSLDSDIVPDSIVINDFPAWFQRHPDTQAVFCNGAKSHETYRKQALPVLEGRHRDLPLHRLPSTSPAHAAMRLEEKLEQWNRITAYL